MPHITTEVDETGDLMWKFYPNNQLFERRFEKI